MDTNLASSIDCALTRDSAYNSAMRRTTIVSLVLLTCVSLRVFAGSPDNERRKAETLAKADKLFGQRYSPPAGKPLRLYDEQTETGPPDAAIYWYGASYVVELIFADDGSVSRVQLLPEELLHSDSWNNVPEYAELSRADMQWLLDSASTLQPLGKPGGVRDATDICFRSGPNLYCTDTYEQALVNHYHLERGEKDHVAIAVLRDISIFYRQPVLGVVEDVRVERGQRQLKVGRSWYRSQHPSDNDVFSSTAKGSFVRLVAFGCAANEKVCPAVPEESTSGVER